MTFFGNKFPFSRPKILMTFLFISPRPGFSDFYSLFSDSPYLCCVNCRINYDPFFTRKTTISENISLRHLFFHSVRAFAPIRQHYFSKYPSQSQSSSPIHARGTQTTQHPSTHYNRVIFAGCVEAGWRLSLSLSLSSVEAAE